LFASSDHDTSVREALKSLVRSGGLHAELFRRAQEFLKYKSVDAPGRLVLDVRLPGSSALDPPRELGAAEIPIVVVTGDSDVAVAQKSGLRLGASPYQSLSVKAAI